MAGLSLTPLQRLQVQFRSGYMIHSVCTCTSDYVQWALLHTIVLYNITQDEKSGRWTCSDQYHFSEHTSDTDQSPHCLNSKNNYRYLKPLQHINNAHVKEKYNSNEVAIRANMAATVTCSIMNQVIRLTLNGTSTWAQ